MEQRGQLTVRSNNSLSSLPSFLSFSTAIVLLLVPATIAYAQQQQSAATTGGVTLDGRLEVSNDSEQFIKDYLSAIITSQLTNSMTIQLTPMGTMYVYSNGGTPTNPSDDIGIMIAQTEMSVANGYQFRDNAVFAPNGTRVLPAISTEEIETASALSIVTPSNSIIANSDDYDGTPDAEAE